MRPFKAGNGKTSHWRSVSTRQLAVLEFSLLTCDSTLNCIVDVRKEDIIVYHSERGSLYQKMLRFTLDDEKDRNFRVQRWCFKGSIDDWIDLSLLGRLVGKLPVLVQQICPHIGRDSFYDLT